MATSFLTSLNEEELANFLKKAINAALDERQNQTKQILPDIMDVKQASEFLRLQVNTLYEKTSLKLIPHFKKGHKLYFKRTELEEWINGGKVKTIDEVRAQADTFAMQKKSGWHKAA